MWMSLLWILEFIFVLKKNGKRCMDVVLRVNVVLFLSLLFVVFFEE